MVELAIGAAVGALLPRAVEYIRTESTWKAANHDEKIQRLEERLSQEFDIKEKQIEDLRTDNKTLEESCKTVTQKLLALKVDAEFERMNKEEDINHLQQTVRLYEGHVEDHQRRLDAQSAEKIELERKLETADEQLVEIKLQVGLSENVSITTVRRKVTQMALENAVGTGKSKLSLDQRFNKVRTTQMALQNKVKALERENEMTKLELDFYKKISYCAKSKLRKLELQMRNDKYKLEKLGDSYSVERERMELALKQKDEKIETLEKQLRAMQKMLPLATVLAAMDDVT